MAFWKTSPPKKTDHSQSPSRHPEAASAQATDKHNPALEGLDDIQDRPANKGFDPYNSGAFDVRHTWERVNRK